MCLLLSNVHLLLLAMITHLNAVQCITFSGSSSLLFTEAPRDTTFSNTEFARIPCKATGQSPLHISWLDNRGRTLKNITGIRTVHSDGTLVFQAFAASDFDRSVHSTKYQCRAENGIGVILSAPIRINAVVNIRYSPEVFHQSSFIGGSAAFECTVPKAAAKHVSIAFWTIKWKSSGTEIVIPIGISKDRFKVLPKLGILVIEHIEKYDSNITVKCTTKDDFNGLILTSTYAHLFIDESSKKDLQLIYAPSSQLVEEGQDVILTCIANAKTIPTYTWFKNGKKIGRHLHTTPILNGTLLLKRVEVSDAGFYKCTASSGHETVSVSMVLNVTERIEFIRQPDNQSIQVGRSVRFFCQVTGHPIPSIIWLKNGKRLNSNDRTLIDRSVLSSNLILYLVSQSDEGIYQCLVNNGIEEKQASSRLIVGAIQPLITRQPPERKVLEQDQSISLECEAKGLPLPQIKWSVDGNGIASKNQRFTITSSLSSSGGRKSTLKIEGLRMSDSGIYECKAENKAGSVTSKTNMAVNGAPTIVNFKEHIFAVIGQSAYLDCNAKGYPLSTFNWFKDNWQNLATNGEYKILENGTLFISQINNLNKGTFKCVAENKFGKDEKTLVLNVLVPPTIAPFKWPPIVAEHRTSKTCEVPTGDLPIRITWYWNGKPVINANDVSVESKDFQSYLTFSKVKPEHRGRYTCKAENKAGSASYSTELIVNEQPVFLQTPDDVSVLKPAPIHLQCTADGFPTPQITWYKVLENEHDRKLIGFSSKFKQFKNGSLFIYSTSADDSGKYSCIAQNGVGRSADKTVTVDVKVPATVVNLSPQIVKKRKGTLAAITCTASGTPVLQLHWYKSSQILTNSSKFRLRNARNTLGRKLSLQSTLEISNLQRSDNGKFLCQATNPFGGDTKYIEMAVLEKPDPPSTLEYDNLSSRWAEITWGQPYNGHLMITNYTLEYRRFFDDWKESRLVIADGNRTRIIVNELSPGIDYHFRIKAMNQIGSSDFSDEIVLKTKEEAPSSAPLNISVTAIAKDKLRVTWKPPADNHMNGRLLGYYIACKEISSSGPARISQRRTVKAALRPEIILDNLTPYTSYLITVQAFTQPGPGPSSIPIRKRTLEGAPTAPPQRVSAVTISSQIIRVQWTLPPLQHRHGLIKGYKVLYTEVATAKVFFKTILRVHYAELTNLRRYSSYSVSVLAFTGGGDGKLSRPIFAKTAEDVPGPPQQLRAAAASPHQILVTWKKPSEPNGIITGYILHYRKSLDRSSSQHEFRLDANTTAQTLHGLEVGKEYEIWINAQTKIGTGMRTAFVRTRTMTKIPARILTLTQIVKVPVNADVGLPCVAVGHPKPTITWRFQGRRIFKRRYKREYYNEGKLILNNVQLKDIGPYNCSAVNPYGSDWNIITLIVQGPPAAPYRIYASQYNTSAINITWVSYFDIHSPIIRYHIKYKFDNESAWLIATKDSDEHWMIFDMKSKHRIFVAVAAENVIGVGSYSVVIEVIRRNNGLFTRTISPIEKSIVRATREESNEKESVIGPILAGCLVAVVVVAVIMLLASWDRVERRLRAPKCNRLFMCEADNNYPKHQYNGTYDGPYNEPNMPWPWNSTGNSFVATNENLPESETNHEDPNSEERFPEHLFAQLLNFDESDEDAEKAKTDQAPISTDKTLLDIYIGRSSSSVYKSSDSAQISKGLFTDNSLISSSNAQSTTDSEHGDGASNFKFHSADNVLNDKLCAEKSKKAAQKPNCKSSVKSLDRDLQQKQRLQSYSAKNDSVRFKTRETAKQNRINTIGPKTLTLLVRDNKVKRSKSVRSYESISSTCSSTRGELVKAYEFGRKYKLQEYNVPSFIDNSTTEDSCSEISELCEFSSLPRNTNDCLLRMPIPIRPLLETNIEENGPGLKSLDGYNGESLV